MEGVRVEVGGWRGRKRAAGLVVSICGCGVFAAGSAPRVAWAQSGSGQTYEPTPELAEAFEFNFERNHDKGVYARASAGLGWAVSDITPGPEGAASDGSMGASMVYGAHLGALVTPRLALHVSQWGQVRPQRGFLSVGPGFTFYFSQAQNLFVSAAAGATTLYDDAPDLGAFAQWGLGSEVELGTGWWVSPHTSMGLSVAAGATAFDIDGDGLAGSSWQVGLRMTFALN